MARRNEHSLDEIKKMLIEAAESIIIDQGYSALTVRKIVIKIGYSVASFYMVFTNIAGLIRQIKTSTLKELIQTLRQLPSDSPEQCIQQLAKTYLHFAVNDFNRWSMIYLTDTEPNGEYQQAINQLHDLLELEFSRLEPHLSLLQVKQAARTLWFSIHGICSLSLTANSEARDIEQVENDLVLLVETFMAGWKTIKP